MPFIPFRLIMFSANFLNGLSSVRNLFGFSSPMLVQIMLWIPVYLVLQIGMNDFALSVNKDTPSVTGYILLGIWIVGMLAMMILVIKSSLRLRTIKRSALPLQNPEVRQTV